MKRELVTAIGTAFLVTTSVGAALLHGSMGALAGALAAGFALVTLSLAFPRASFHPLGDAAAWAAGKLPWRRAGASLLAQLLGAIAGVAVILFLLKSKREGYDVQALGVGAAGIGEHSPAHFDWLGVVMAESCLGFVFGLVAATRRDASQPWLLGLTFAACNLVALPMTGGSLHPAQNVASALFTGGRVVADLWAVALVPLAAAALGGLGSRWLLRED